MRASLRSFVDEIVKLSAFPQHEQAADPYDSSSAVGKTMDSTSGAGARAGLKAGPVATAAAPMKLAPTPMTSPNSMVDVASKNA